MNKRQPIKGKRNFHVINTPLWITVLIEHVLRTRRSAQTCVLLTVPAKLSTKNIYKSKY